MLKKMQVLCPPGIERIDVDDCSFQIRGSNLLVDPTEQHPGRNTWECHVSPSRDGNGKFDLYIRIYGIKKAKNDQGKDIHLRLLDKQGDLVLEVVGRIGPLFNGDIKGFGVYAKELISGSFPLMVMQFYCTML